mgnify:CR=1 FL=1
MPAPYVQAALIGAIPTTIMASATWYGVHKGRKDNSNDHGKVHDKLEKLADGQKELGRNVDALGKDVAALDTKVQKLDLRVERMDLRFDALEDGLQRHLGWHRNQAANELPEALAEGSLERDYRHSRND